MLCQQHVRPSQKKTKRNRNKEGSLSTCDQQYLMNCQEHNRSYKGMLRGKEARSHVRGGSTRKRYLLSSINYSAGNLCLVVQKKHPHEITGVTALICSQKTCTTSHISRRWHEGPHELEVLHNGAEIWDHLLLRVLLLYFSESFCPAFFRHWPCRPGRYLASRITVLCFLRFRHSSRRVPFVSCSLLYSSTSVSTSSISGCSSNV